MDKPRIATERRGQVFVITFDREEKRNAFDRRMLRELAAAYTEYEGDPDLRCAVVTASGAHFTGGLDLGDVAPAIMRGEEILPADLVNPWRTGAGAEVTKPVVVAVQGKCLTLGIELSLAADVRIADETATFAQIEIQRGIFPFGGATARFVEAAGWGNAMRWLLTGDEFDAKEALRIGIVQEIVPAGTQAQRAIALAERIAAQAPLGVRATLRSARLALGAGPGECFDALPGEITKLFATEDARIGLQAFMTRTTPLFVGR